MEPFLSRALALNKGSGLLRVSTHTTISGESELLEVGLTLEGVGSAELVVVGTVVGTRVRSVVTDMRPGRWARAALPLVVAIVL